jgi:N4-gp56 family major capsid protein
MANTVYGINDPETNKRWAKKLNVEALKKTWVGKFIGSDDNSLIHEQKDLKKSKGDEITLTLRAALKGKGTAGDAIMKGSEEKLSTFTDKVRVDQLRHSADRGGNMSQQRVLWDMREQCNAALSDWWGQRIDRWFFNVIAGYTATDEVDEFGELNQGSDVRFTGMQATTAPTSGRHFWSESGTSADENLDSTGDRMTLGLLDDLITEAKLASPSMRPIKWEGEDMYAFFMHTIQARDMRKEAGEKSWMEIQKALLAGGDGKKNGIFTGAMGVYNNVVLFDSTRVARGVNSSTGASISDVRRATLCGAQAVGLAFGNGSDFESWNWAEEEEDYGNQLGVGAGCIAGMKKSKFNSSDFGTLVLSTWAAKAL